ncbi:MAG: hypothetical protein OXI81_04410 [Paracoccaceae bacterium]|nr:hypothetical protein [Paracoccaceae bacterium]
MRPSERSDRQGCSNARSLFAAILAPCENRVEQTRDDASGLTDETPDLAISGFDSADGHRERRCADDGVNAACNLPADGGAPENPVFDVANCGNTTVVVASLPLDTNVGSVTIMAMEMPYPGHGRCLGDRAIRVFADRPEVGGFPGHHESHDGACGNVD